MYEIECVRYAVLIVYIFVRTLMKNIVIPRKTFVYNNK